MRRVFGNAGLLTAVVCLALWQILSYFTPNYLFPSLPEIGRELWGTITRSPLHAVLTFWRILLGLVVSFVVGSALGIVCGGNRKVAEYVLPFLTFLQGIPALSWVVIAIIWFKAVELRILFILVAVSVPNFTFQVLDAMRAISKELWEMVNSVRPRPFQLFTKLVLPGVVPGMLTAWKVNLGNATRVAIVAELVGATVGVGYQLATAQQLFNMAAALAWTLVLVFFVLLAQWGIEAVEAALLRWRPRLER